MARRLRVAFLLLALCASAAVWAKDAEDEGEKEDGRMRMGRLMCGVLICSAQSERSLESILERHIRVSVCSRTGVSRLSPTTRVTELRRRTSRSPTPNV